MNLKLKGAALAAAAAGVFMTASVQSATAGEAKVKCDAVNACKGQSECRTALSYCKGQNACKGQGWLEVTKKECEEAKAKAKAAKEKKS